MGCVIHGSSSDGLYYPIKALVSSLQLSQQTKGRVWSRAESEVIECCLTKGLDIEEVYHNVPNLT